MKLKSHVSFTRFIISLLFIAGMILFSFSDVRSSLLTLRMNQTTVNYIDAPEDVTDIKPVENITAPSTKEIITTQSTNEDVLGYISIPDLGINEPIYKNTTNQTLLFGVSSLYPQRSPEDDNIVLLGHHLGYYGSLFGRLNEANKGMAISLVYLGNTYNYVVHERAIVSEKRTDLVNNTHEQPYLTLITCDTPEYTDQRTVVTAKLLETKKMDKIDYQNQRITLANKRTDSLALTMNELNHKWIKLGIVIVLGLIFINTILIRRKKITID